MISEIKRIGIKQDAVGSNEVFPNPDDAVFFEVALAEKSEQRKSCLVTGNIKHFPDNPVVVTPTQFVALVELYKGRFDGESESNDRNM